MAITDSTTITTLQINTGDSPKSINELRSRIKELKNELVSLDTESERYNEVLLETGNLTHQLREVQEQVNLTMADYGQNLTNINSVLSGGVASVTAITSALSLMGVELGDDDKLTKSLVKSMALIQSLSTIDNATKSFKALTTTIKLSTTAAGGLGKALKALAVSNPFTAILAAATAVIAVLSKISQKNKEAAEEMKKAQEEAAEKAKEAWEKTYKNLDELFQKQSNTSLDWNFYWDLDEFNKQKDEVLSSYDNYGKALIDLEKRNAQLKKEMDANKLKSDWQYSKDGQKVYNEFYDNLRKIRLIYLSDYVNDTSEEAKKATALIQQQWAEVNKLQAEYNQNANKPKSNSSKSTTNTKEKQQDDEYKREQAKLKLHLAEQLSLIEKSYQEQINVVGLTEKEKEKIETEYREKSKGVNEEYYNSLIKLTENYKTKVEKRKNNDDALIAVNQSLQDQKDALEKVGYEWDAYTTEMINNAIALERENALLQANADYINGQNDIIIQQGMERTDLNNKELEYLEKQNELLLILGLTTTEHYQQEIEYERQLLDIQQQKEQISYDNENIENQINILKEQLDAKLILQEDYNYQVASLEQQRFTNVQMMNDLEVEEERIKLDKKRQLNQNYKKAISSITSSIADTLNSLSEAEGVSFENSKRMKIAAATISTIQGALAAYNGMIEAIPGPAGIIAGAAASIATIAAGMIQIQQIKNTKIESTTTPTPTSGNVVYNAPTQTNLTGISSTVEIPESRVYVLESDITNAQNRVQVQQQDSTF